MTILYSACCWGQAPRTPQPGVQQPAPWTEHYRNSTVSFGRVVTDGGHQIFQVLGAGVIVAIDRSHGYIVTAKHVFDDPKQNWHPAELRVRFAWEEKDSVDQNLGTVLKLTDAAGQNLWNSLDDNSDIAAIPMPNNFRKLDAIYVQEFAGPDDLYDGATIIVLGFPAIVGNEKLVRAVTRSGIVAWTDPTDPIEEPFFVDANIMPGNSGGPAFKVPTGMTRGGALGLGGQVTFLGIVSQNVSGYYSVTADGRIVQVKFPDLPLPSAAQVEVTGIGGLGKVEPAEKIRKLVQQLYDSSNRSIPPAQ